MAPDRRAALTAGVLFIVATAASLLSYAVEHPVLTGTDYLTRIAENTGQVSAGGLLELVAAGASAGIAISLYPVLRKRSQGLALGAVVFRALEAVMYTVGAVITLSLLTSPGSTRRQPPLATAGPGDRGRSYRRARGRDPGGRVRLRPRRPDVLLPSLPLAPGPALVVGLGYRGRVPDPHRLPVGLVQPHSVTSYTILIVPIAVQEIVLAAWLIFRGFSPSAGQAGTVTGSAPAGNRDATRQPAA